MQQPLPPQNPARRRLAKGAVAVPAVLASISTKNALANPIYACTVSGKMSGNFSPATNRTADQSCKAGFNTPAQWAVIYSGDQSNADVPAWLGITMATPAQQSGRPRSGVSSTPTAPTRYLVFTQSSLLAFSKDATLTVNAFAVYCNAMQFGAAYHVSAAECEQLFAAATTQGGSFTKNQKTWYQAQCIEYLNTVATA